MEDCLSIAREIFERTCYPASDEDIKKLADNMDFLEKRGLGKLNNRLIDARKHSKIFETIAEHNFDVILISRHSPVIPISYEPNLDSLRPPDFKVEIENVTYWIQMKDLSKLKRENRQDKLIQKIREKTKAIKVGKFFSCMMSDDFKENCVPELIDFMKGKATSATEKDSFFFTSKNSQKAKIKFWSPSKIGLSELTLGYSGDLEMSNITGLDREQIKKSLLNAVGAFNRETDENNINLIVMEADNKEDIDICDALFGTEHEMFNSTKGYLEWSRNNDGLFSETDFSKKVAGVIAIKRKRERFKESESSELPSDAENYANYLKKDCGWTDEKIKKALKWKNPGPIADYHLILCINEKFKHLLENIKILFRFDKIIHCNMRSPMGQGNFSCETEEYNETD